MSPTFDARLVARNRFSLKQKQVAHFQCVSEHLRTSDHRQSIVLPGSVAIGLEPITGPERQFLEAENDGPELFCLQPSRAPGKQSLLSSQKRPVS